MLSVCHYEDEDELRLVYQYYVQPVTYTQRCLCASAAAAVYKDLCGICGISIELFSWPVDYRHLTWWYFQVGISRFYDAIFLVEGAKHISVRLFLLAVLINYADILRGREEAQPPFALAMCRLTLDFSTLRIRRVNRPTPIVPWRHTNTVDFALTIVVHDDVVVVVVVVFSLYLCAVYQHD